MRKVVALEHITLDGFASSGKDLGFEFTWPGYSEELAAYVGDVVQADFDTAMYGRETYLGMYGYWSAQPTAESTPGERAHAEWVNAVDKVVFSTTLESAEWNNTRLIATDVAQEVRALKAKAGGALAIYASPKLVHSFLDMGLIDEFRILIHPVTLGAGTPLFHDKAQMNLELLESRSFDSGVVYVRYSVR
ncbi:dihydrofolate reductase family protein [Nocardia sp. alder85J]|uniref:dihydrofolate reductase family protein n=1 Tax=Nocardia sp. alder85J TaxID=2862949 RepID=UPI001CD5D5AB|nr:dihydrofolate reductase family protein [Nocardia sp. alder85J]MCX4090887.1 dihydrofolate reductase family protein [Nocardia sp. alder85J]